MAHRDPRFHLDQDVTREVARWLNAHYGDAECAKAATELGLHRAHDGHHLLVAAQAGRIFVTHNREDFIAMHDAWLRWSSAWSVTPPPQHTGILIIPQPLRPPIVTREIAAFLGNRTALPNEIHLYDEDAARWVQDPIPRRRRRAT